MPTRRRESTSPPVASIAGKLLRDPKTPKHVKRVAATALTQVDPSRARRVKRTGKRR